MDRRRWLPLSGIVFVVVSLGAVVGLGGETPDSDASGARVASFYEAREARHIAAAFLLAASLPFLVFFAASLATRLWPAEGTRRPVWELVLVGGSVVTASVLMIVALLHFAVVDSADEGMSAGALEALNVLDADSWIAFNAALGVMMLGAAGSLLPRAGAYRWLGWTALVLGIALFVPFADFIALLLTLVWIVVTSVMLFRAQRETGYAVAPDMA